MVIARKLTSLATSWYTLANKFSGVVLLLNRIFIARVFLLSGLGKWTGFFQFNPDTYDLFLYEFFCPEEPRKGALRLCGADAEYSEGSTQFIIERLANIAGLMEVVFGLMLIFGLFSRIAALGLLGITLFIQFFVFTDSATWWGSHAWWFAALLVVMTHGPGLISLDRFFKVEKDPVKAA